MAMAHSKSAITPPRKGRMTSIVPGTRPNMRLASLPTARTRSLPFTRLTTDGSRMTTPRPRRATRVLAVPRSIAKSFDKRLLSFLMSKVHSLLRVQYLTLLVSCQGGTPASHVFGPCALHTEATYLRLKSILYRKSNVQLMIFWGIRVRRDNWASVRYAEGLNSSKSSVTLKSTDR